MMAIMQVRKMEGSFAQDAFFHNRYRHISSSRPYFSHYSVLDASAFDVKLIEDFSSRAKFFPSVIQC